MNDLPPLGAEVDAPPQPAPAAAPPPSPAALPPLGAEVDAPPQPTIQAPKPAPVAAPSAPATFEAEGQTYSLPSAPSAVGDLRASEGQEQHNDDARLGAILDAGFTRNPDQHAAVLGISRQTGVPAEIVEAQFPLFKQKAAAAGFEPARFRRENPGIADILLQKPQLAPLVQGDLAHLHGLEWALKAPLAALSQAGRQEEYTARANAALLGAGGDANEARLREIEGQPPQDLGDDSLATKVYLKTIEMLPTLAKYGVAGKLGAATGALVGAPFAGVGAAPGAVIGGLASMAVLGFYDTLGPSYRRYVQQGIEPETAQHLATAQAVVVGGINAALGPIFAKAIPGVGKAFSRELTGAVEKALVKTTFRTAATTAVKNYTEHYASGVGLMTAIGTVGEVTNQIGQTTLGKPFSTHAVIEAVKSSMEGAAIAMPLLAGWAPATQFFGDVGRAHQSAQGEMHLRAALESAQKSNLVEKAPDEAKGIISSLAQGALVFFDKQGWDATWKAKGVEPRELAAKVMGDEGRAYDESNATGGKLAIPKADALTHLSRMNDPALVRDLWLHATANLEDSTPVQRKADAERIAAKFKTVEGEAPKGEDPVKVVYADAYAKARAAGQPDRVAGIFAETVSRSTAYMAAKEEKGRTALDVWQEHPLAVHGPSESAEPGEPMAAQRLKATAAIGKVARVRAINAEIAQIESEPAPALAATAPAAGEGAGGAAETPSAVVAPRSGTSTSVVTPHRPGGEAAHYQAIEVERLIASHQADNFQPNPAYPEGVQEREYHRDRAEQMKVQQGGERLNPAMVLSDVPEAVSGPPLVSAGEKSLVLGGNGRSMMIQRAFKSDATREAYRKALLAKAGALGLDPAEIEKMTAPVLVRVMDEVRHDASKEDLQAAVRRFNLGMTQELSPAARAVAESRSMTPETVQAIGQILADSGESSLRDIMRENPRALIEILRRDIITTQNQSEWLAGGALTDAAKDRIEGMFLGRVVGSGDRMAATSPAVLAKLERIAPALLRVQGVNKGMDEVPTVQAALDLINEARQRGMRLDDFLQQGSLFGGSERGPEAALAKVLEETKPKALAARFTAWADAAAFDPRQATMFQAAPTQDQARAHLYQDAINPRLSALRQERDGIVTGLEQSGIARPFWEQLRDQSQAKMDALDAEHGHTSFSHPGYWTAKADLARATEALGRVSKLEQAAYHGTPHRGIKQFLLDKIGTGEGAQAYGWGLYFAEKLGIAEDYRRQLSERVLIVDGRRIDSRTAGSTVAIDGQPLPLEAATASEADLAALRAYGRAEVLARDLPNQSAGPDRAAMAKGWEAAKNDIDEQERSEREIVEKSRIVVAKWEKEPPPPLQGWGDLGTAEAQIETEQRAIARHEAAIRDLRMQRDFLTGHRSLGVKVEEGQTYEVDLPEKGDLLDWDSNLQSQKKALSKIPEEDRIEFEDSLDAAGYAADISAFSGQQFYELLERSFEEGGVVAEAAPDATRGDEAASRYLGKRGISGLVYLDGSSRKKGEGTHNFVIWDENHVHVTGELHQPGATGPRGALRYRLPDGSPRDFDLHLFASHDPTTPIHESMHYLVEVLADLASKPGSSETLKKDYGVLLDAMGYASHDERLAQNQERVDLGAKSNRAASEEMRLRHLTAKEETVTHQWEQYFAAGKTTTPELQGVFTWMKNTFLKLYRGFKGGAHEAIAAQFQARYGEALKPSAEVTKLFDRLLAANDSVEGAEKDAGHGALPEAVLASLPPSERAQLEDADRIARDAAEQDLVRRMRDDEKKENTEFIAGERDRFRAEADKGMDAEPVYRALSWLKDGELHNPDGTVWAEPPEMFLNEQGEPWKLDRQSLAKAYGPEYVAALASKHRGIFAKKGEGKNADDMAELLGYGSGKELIADLQAGQDRASVVEGQVQRRLEETYPSLLQDPQQLVDAAIEAVHDDKHLAAILAKRRALARAIDPGRPVVDLDKEAIRGMARQTMESKPVGEIRPAYYLQAEQSAGRRAFRLAEEGKLAQARDEYESQALNLELWRAARDAREEVDVAERQMKQGGQAPWRAALGKADADLAAMDPPRPPVYLSIHDQILEALGLAEKPAGNVARPGLAEFLAQAAADGERPRFDPEAIASLLQNPKAWAAVAKGDALTIRDAILQIHKFAGARNEVVLLDRRTTRTDVIDQMIGNLEKLPAQPKIPRDPLLSDTVGRRTRLLGQSLDVLTMDIDTMAHALDGGDRDGIFHQVFIDERTKARDKRAALTERFLSDLLPRFEKSGMDRKRLYEEIDVSADLPLSDKLKETWADGKVTRANLLMMLHNLGNASNEERFLGGFGWTREQVQKTLEKHLNAKEAGWVQGNLDALEGLYPEMARVHAEDEGLPPEKIAAVPFTFHALDGDVEMAGGYFPAKYDPRPGSQKKTGERQVMESVADFLAPDYGGRGLSVRASHAKGRAEHFEDVVNLDMGVLPSHVLQVIQDIAFRKYVKQTAAIVLDDRFNNAMVQHYGEERAKMPRAWLKAVANATAETVPEHLGRVERFFTGLKSRAAFAALAYSIPRTLANVVSDPMIAATSGLVSPAHVARVTAELAANWTETRKFVLDNMGEVRDRELNLGHHLRAEMGTMGGKAGMTNPILRAARESGFLLMEYGDRLVSTIMAKARYDQTISAKIKEAQAKNGRGLDADEAQAAHVEAVRDANDVVRQVLPPHDIADKSALTRDRNLLGSLTLFAGHANKMWQLYYRRPASDVARTFHDPEASIGAKFSVVGKFSARILTTMMVNGVVAEYVAGAGQQDDETKAEWLARKAISGAAYPLPPLLGALVSIAADKAITGHAKKLSVRSAPGIEFATRIGQDAWKALQGDETAGKSAMALAELVGGFATTAPTRQVHHTLGYLHDVATGETTYRGPLDLLGGAIYGEDPRRHETNPLTDAQSLASGE